MKLATQRKIFQGGDSTEWTPQLIQRLERINNPISRAVDFWVDNIWDGYITKIAVDTIRSYNEIEREFFQEPRGRYLKSLKLWIKMLVYEKGILWMDSD